MLYSNYFSSVKQRKMAKLSSRTPSAVRHSILADERNPSIYTDHRRALLRWEAKKVRETLEIKTYDSVDAFLKDNGLNCKRLTWFTCVPRWKDQLCHKYVQPADYQYIEVK